MTAIHTSFISFIFSFLVAYPITHTVGQSNQMEDNYPYLVAILEKETKQFVCASTIIDKQWILTSGSPVVGQLDPEELLVLAGVDSYYDFDDLGATGQLIDVAEYFYTDNYTEKMAVGNSAVIKLASPLTYNLKVLPINMLDVSHNQSRILAHYQFNDPDITAFLQATVSHNKELTGWDIYGQKTSLEVQADINDPDWFKEWSRSIFWGYSHASDQAASQMMEGNMDGKDAPFALPFYRPVSNDDNILTYGFTGAPLVCDGKLCGVGTWWMQSLVDGELSTEVQGDPEAVLAVRRWIDYSPVLDPFVMAVTVEENTAFEQSGMYAGVGNGVPTHALEPDFSLPYDALAQGDEPLPELAVKAREVITWQSNVNARYQYLASDRIILKPGFYMNADEPVTPLLQVIDNNYPGLHARIKPLGALVDAVGLMMNSGSLNLGYLMIQELWPEAAIFSYNGQGDLFTGYTGSADMPPITMLTGGKRSREDTADQMRDEYDDDDGDRPSKRKRTSGDGGGDGGGGGNAGAGAGGDGDDPNNGGGGNNDGSNDDNVEEEKGDDEGDNEEEDEIMRAPNDRTLTYRLIDQIIDWEYVAQNGGLDHNRGDDLTTRLPACQQQLIFELFHHAQNINDELGNQERRDFIRGLHNQMQQVNDLIDEVWDYHGIGVTIQQYRDVYNLDPDFLHFETWQLRLLQPYGFNVDGLMGPMIEAFDRIPVNNGLYNTYQPRALHARVIEQHIDWNAFHGVNPDNGHFDGVDELIQNLIINATHIVLDAFTAERNPQILTLYNHIRRQNPNQFEMDRQLMNYYNWRPQGDWIKEPNENDCLNLYEKESRVVGNTYDEFYWTDESESTLLLQPFALFLNRHGSLINWFNNRYEIEDEDDTDVDSDVDSGDADNLARDEYAQELSIFNNYFTDDEKRKLALLFYYKKYGFYTDGEHLLNIDDTWMNIAPEGHNQYLEFNTTLKTAILSLFEWIENKYIVKYREYIFFEINDNEHQTTLTIDPNYELDQTLQQNYPTIFDDMEMEVSFYRLLHPFLDETSFVEMDYLIAVFRSHMNSYYSCRAVGRTIPQSISEYHLRLYQYLLNTNTKRANPIVYYKNTEIPPYLTELIEYIRANPNPETTTDPVFLNDGDFIGAQVQNNDRNYINLDLGNFDNLYAAMRNHENNNNREPLEFFHLRYGYNADHKPAEPVCINELVKLINGASGEDLLSSNRTLDLGMFVRSFKRLLQEMFFLYESQDDIQSLATDLLNGLRDWPDQSETAEKLFKILLLVKQQVPNQSPWLDDLKMANGPDERLYMFTVDLVRYLLTEYIPNNRDIILARFNLWVKQNGDLDPTNLLDQKYYVRHFIETRALNLNLLEYYIDWPEFDQARQNGNELLNALGCRLDNLRRLILGAGNYQIRIAGIDPNKLNNPYHFPALLKIIKAIRDEKIVNQNRPPDEFWLENFQEDPINNENGIGTDDQNNRPEDYMAFGCPPAESDQDQDSVADHMEDINNDGNLNNDDTDGDGLPNFLDNDDDGDGVPTINEDANGNGNLFDDDDNGNGLVNFLDPLDDTFYDLDNFWNNGRQRKNYNVELNEEAHSSVLYPNPSSGDISITRLDETLNYQVTITDLSGNVVYNFTYTDFLINTAELKIELHELPNGVYIMQLDKGEGKVDSFRFVISK